MKNLLLALALGASFLSAQTPASNPAASQTAAPETLAADTPKTTTAGNTFIAPKDWKLRVSPPATILEAPEGDSFLALVDVANAKSADEAVKAAWQAYRPDAKWPVLTTNDLPDRDGWTHRRAIGYLTSPNEKRTVAALVLFANNTYTVLLEDLSDATSEKRGGQLALIGGRLLPKGYSRENFAGKRANKLDQARLAELGKFVEDGRKEIGIQGVSLGIVQDGRLIFADGFGTKELGASEKPDADTLFMIASNTKALTTLLLAKLVDQHRLDWTTPVTTLMPSFKLGDAQTTQSVLVKHLICACTGMPRQDLEWIVNYGKATPESTMALLGTMQPTSKFGELFQYSNLMAAAAGYTAGHVANPNLPIGAAYDRAMQSYVFDPLGMSSTTFDYQRALSGNHASPHAPDIDGHPAKALMDVNYSIIPARPAGAAWSSVHDMLKYVSMELANGKLPDGGTYISSGPLLERRASQVHIGKDVTYGMGLEVDTTYGVPVVHHGGDMIGFHSDMIWIPDQNVGAVILTNTDGGWILRGRFSRKLLEVLYDGRPEADALMAADAKSYFNNLAAQRKLLTVPADPTESAKLARHYSNASLGTIAVSASGNKTIFDFGVWKSEVASKKNPDGTLSYVTIVPGMEGLEFTVGAAPDKKRTLVIRDAQHEYTYTEQ